MKKLPIAEIFVGGRVIGRQLKYKLRLILRLLMRVAEQLLATKCAQSAIFDPTFRDIARDTSNALNKQLIL